MSQSQDEDSSPKSRGKITDFLSRTKVITGNVRIAQKKRAAETESSEEYDGEESGDQENEVPVKKLRGR